MTTETTNDQIRDHLRDLLQVFYYGRECNERMSHEAYEAVVVKGLPIIEALKPLVEAKLDAEEAAQQEETQDPPTEGGGGGV